MRLIVRDYVLHTTAGRAQIRDPCNGGSRRSHHRQAVRGPPPSVDRDPSPERPLPCLPPKWGDKSCKSYRRHQPGAGVDRVAGSGDALRLKISVFPSVSFRAIRSDDSRDHGTSPGQSRARRRHGVGRVQLRQRSALDGKTVARDDVPMPRRPPAMRHSRGDHQTGRARTSQRRSGTRSGWPRPRSLSADDVAWDPSIVADRVEFALQFRRGRADRYLDGAYPPRPRRR